MCVFYVFNKKPHVLCVNNLVVTSQQKWCWLLSFHILTTATAFLQLLERDTR